MKAYQSKIDDITTSFSGIVHDMNHEQLNTKPAPEVWSMAQILDHLIVINNTYEPILQSLHQGTFRPPFHAKIPFIVSFFGNLILKGVRPENKKKTKTFPMWEPSKTEIPENIWELFSKHQELLKSWIAESQDLIKKGVVIHSPASKIIVYTLEKAFDIIVAHEERHLEQARELKKNLAHR